MVVIGFDLETFPIGPKKSPPIVAGGLNIPSHLVEKAGLGLRWGTHIIDKPDEESIWFFNHTEVGFFLDLIELEDVDVVVAHNGAYDWACICAHSPSFIARVYRLFLNKKVECTFVRSLILFGATGLLKAKRHTKVTLSADTVGLFSLAGSLHTYSKKDISQYKDKEIQTSYHKVFNKPVDQWGEDYVNYLVNDVEHLPQLYRDQEALGHTYITEIYFKTNALKESKRRALYHFSLQLASAWGIRVDPKAVSDLKDSIERDVQDAAENMVDAGYAEYLSGRAFEKALASNKLPIKVLQAEVRRAVEEDYGENAPKTSKDNISTTREVLAGCKDPVLKEWAEVGAKKTLLSTFIPPLDKAKGNHNVVNTNFFPYSETGRISAFAPNLLNPPRMGGLRECFVAREGCCFIFCDYEGNELRVLAQVLLDQLGGSRLADFYKEDPTFDPHTYMACQRLGIEYTEGQARKKAKDSEFKSVRQIMKACDFGFPGGMASHTFVEFCKGYKIEMTEKQAEELKDFFFTQFPEISKYHRKVSNTVSNHAGQGYLARAHRVTGNRSFCQLANFYFQGLASEGGLTAFSNVSWACYANPKSPLYGSRPLLFIHDEIVLESPLERAHDAAIELKRVMEVSMCRYTPDIPSLAEPALALRWTKDAYTKYNAEGHLIPCDMED
jgi:hypothetical protein